MRLDGHDVHVHGKAIPVCRLIVGGAGRNVDALAAKPDHRRQARGQVVCEVQADPKLHWLRLAGRRHVRLDDEVASGRQLPRSVLQQPRHLTRRPSEEMAVRELCLAAAAAVESRAGFLLVEATRRSRRVDFHIGVVDGSGCAGTKFQPADEPRPRHGYRDHERAKDVGAVGRQHIGFRHRDDEVGRPKPPAVGARRRRRQIRRIPLGRCLLDPAPDRPDLRHRQSPGAGEVAVARLGLPRRHVAIAGRPGDLGRARAHVGIGHETERRRFTGPMARRAVLEDDWRDVAVERDLLRGHVRGPGHDGRREHHSRNGPHLSRRNACADGAGGPEKGGATRRTTSSEEYSLQNFTPPEIRSRRGWRIDVGLPSAGPYACVSLKTTLELSTLNMSRLMFNCVRCMLNNFRRLRST